MNLTCQHAPLILIIEPLLQHWGLLHQTNPTKILEMASYYNQDLDYFNQCI